MTHKLDGMGGLTMEKPSEQVDLKGKFMEKCEVLVRC